VLLPYTFLLIFSQYLCFSAVSIGKSSRLRYLPYLLIYQTFPVTEFASAFVQELSHTWGVIYTTPPGASCSILSQAEFPFSSTGGLAESTR